jgi:hypothetical protein
MNKRGLAWLAFLALLVCACGASTVQSDTLGKGFAEPPATAQPWVYWFWLNGNITKAGITADLEAMHRVGIGGVLIMEVDQGAPLGPVSFAGPEWRELFKFVCSEAHRLGMQVNMTNDAGWDGSGGPWITPETSMKKVVWTETTQEGPTEFDGKLAQPETVRDYYRDISVVAFPAVGSYRIPNIAGKSGLVRQDLPATAEYGEAPADSIIDPAKLVDLTSKLERDGTLHWNVPAGKWTIMRIGYTTTGVENHPSPVSGLGLECDKLSKEGSEAAFNGLMAKLTADVGPLVGKSLVRTHIDSWENGSQNWTAKFPEEFKKRRGYDPLPYMVVYSGHVLGSLENSERFLWDVRQTIGELVADNYAGHFEELARQHGIDLSIEAYGDCVFDDVAYGGRADEPMAEFWAWPGNFTAGCVYEMASSAHVYGKHILGAESFTSTDGEKWLLYPGKIKAEGDWALCRGVNRFVFHRYAMQPWLNAAPGMSMGPWGLHYERTETWWEQSKPWHRYLARCQYMLRQGLPVVDLLYVAPEGSPSSFNPPTGAYRADSCPAEVVEKRLKVKNGRLVLPDGVSYQALVLPDTGVMTYPLLEAVQRLAGSGALIVGGKPPTKAPGRLEQSALIDYVLDDAGLARRAASLWRVGVHGGVSAEKILNGKGVVPDFVSNRGFDYNHRATSTADIYFVANPHSYSANDVCKFRVVGKHPELWNPETGATEPVPIYSASTRTTDIPLRLGPSGSVFVVFKPGPAKPAAYSISKDGKVVWPVSSKAFGVKVLHASWGPMGDAARTKDVTRQVQEKLKSTDAFGVAELAAEGDPALGVVKTLTVDYEVGGKKSEVSATDPETISFPVSGDAEPPAKVAKYGRATVLEAAEPGTYRVAVFRDVFQVAKIAPWRTTLPVSPIWTLHFPGDDKLMVRQIQGLTSWTALLEPAKHFSGTASYKARLDVPAEMVGKDRRLYLDLGRVEVMAEVFLNGKDLGILWHAPFTVDVTGTAHAGGNDLEIRVTNLWPNRMIGDEFLPEDSDRNGDGTLKQWPDWLQRGEISPTGRQSFTSWRLWHKEDKLLPSGLLGPVWLKCTRLVPLLGAN